MKGPGPGPSETRRYCRWVADDELARRFHDEEWGRDPGTDRAWFELLCLEVFQAGLSWRLVLRRREALREVFAGFEPAVLAGWTGADIERALGAPGMIRNRRKLEAVVRNAGAFLGVLAEDGSFGAWVDGLLAEGGEDAVAREFRRRFRFLGPTLVRSLLESAGRLPLPHDPDCYAAGGGG
ncbi:DNA-3-methyladenine glycosylase I [Deferrisoma sp.]